MNKINLYIFNQIVKSCTLVFFIFVSIAWLMQISRIFTMMSNLNIQFFEKSVSKTSPKIRENKNKNTINIINKANNNNQESISINYIFI